MEALLIVISEIRTKKPLLSLSQARQLWWTPPPTSATTSGRARPTTATSMASTRSPKSTETLSRARSLLTEQTYHRPLRESCRTYQMRARRGSFLRRVHLSSSSQPATRLPLMKRILPQVVCLPTQSKRCPLTTIKPSLSAATWKH